MREALEQGAAYRWLLLAGIAASVLLWRFAAPRRPGLWSVYFGALAGAFTGAKLVYILAEGWMHFGEDAMWYQLATGKTIVGALLGGYAGVEIAKKIVGYLKPTGDWFALVAPVGILFGRAGCLLHGCCLGVACRPDRVWALRDAGGVSRWPAVPAEMAFQVSALALILLLRRAGAQAGQHFHLYLIAYGIFRFAHEFLRVTPKPFAGLSGYQFAALGLVALGAWGYRKRRRAGHAAPCHGITAGGAPSGNR